ncbi:5-amino-6-(5-phospho-D-ribitylamino)uracil phosphatase YcsE [Spiroplasma sp. JKS002669]|uniref:Cof-type HAD-IIB family hydrolase n=1 Tax=Spiroplasma attinicola TaxID=2904537 RepID=UPI002022C46C|nr:MULTISPECIES: Cof-type HAD-IIB family hydrolase [unclassified Spiroplasma]MCL6429199.1 5-amino-6-(5-phospho-D-ribitylamino)uracil phosphatase YcsE [Spiroplasma sp. JKS002669]MCL8209480.1 5-amino-6-(5-phospho-D-ribitylamino)uracil phosphatase YcsE [Spiroplasma sp. JKS002670]MCL8210299.1 5-amino-6-(5-phospho-D-ribitylamino)uracil phosphatase YcsE [Spiroplasma sp. JKS002671]
MAIKLIALDLDGTLLKSKRKIHPKNLAMVHRVYQEKPEIKIVIATGRAPLSTIKHAKKCLINPKTPGQVICYNGGNIIDFIDDKQKLLFESVLLPSQTKVILEFARKNNLRFWAYGTDNKTAYVDRYSLRGYILEHFQKLKVKKISENQIVSFYKVLFFCKSKKQLAEMLKKMAKYQDLEVASSSHLLIEVTPVGINKANGLKFLAEKWNIKPEEILACGDSMNDYKMLQWVKYGIAMKNANPELKTVAYEVTSKTNKKAGVAQAIEKYVFSS